MKRLARLVVLSSALLGAHTAHATLPDSKLAGTVTVKKGKQLSCRIKVEVANNKATVDLSPGNLLCNMVSFRGGPYDIEVSDSTVRLRNVDVSTAISGGCAGDIEAQWDGTTLKIDTTLPPKTSGSPCIVKGTAELSDAPRDS
ncbi:hypothetical protein [Pedomonas mirosovicensis]|uniref:hypothetical protein n=1 Tax=Pedomonas mirosovicensis TaxID=2908641 RepID=UPI0021685872|nr:hypothetical protein [Pedomonas mirosovicensis]MCH8686513.1 hypothetical protein [Pedomonas mirosovicensis]